MAFGIPGSFLALFRSLADSPELDFITTVTEAGAAYMADGYARITGNLGVCVGNVGAGVLNMTTALAAASAERTPLLAIGGQVAPGVAGHGAAQDASGSDSVCQRTVMAAVCRSSLSIDGPGKIFDAVQEALSVWYSSQPGPVYIEAADSVWQSYCQSIDVERPRNTHPPVLKNSDITEIVNTLTEYRPLLLFGAGARKVPKNILEEVIFGSGCPWAVTLREGGWIPRSLPGFSGLLGISGHDLPRQMLVSGQVQGMVAIGARLGQMTTCGWHASLRPRKLAVVDSTNRAYFPSWAPDLKVIGPIDCMCRAIADGLKKYSHQVESELSEKLKKLPDSRAAYVASLINALPADSWLFSESIYDGVGAELAGSGLRFECSTNLGGIGCAVSTGLGAQIADPARHVVSITGDGGFLMNVQELLTAARYRIPMMTIVFRNGLLGAVRTAFDRHIVVNREVTECPGPLFMPFLHSMGIRAVEVSSPKSVEEHVSLWASKGSDRLPFVIVIDERLNQGR